MRPSSTAQIPARRLGRPQDFAAVAVFLASDQPATSPGRRSPAMADSCSRFEPRGPMAGLYDSGWRLEKRWRSFGCRESLGFGLVPAPVMYSATFADGQWSRGSCCPTDRYEILPGARALHFAEQAFEGMKAYRVGRATANLFRARDNCARFKRSAERLAMPPVPESLFLEGVEAVVSRLHAFHTQSDRAVAVRPTLPIRHRTGICRARVTRRSFHGHREPVRCLQRRRDEGPRSRGSRCGRQAAVWAR